MSKLLNALAERLYPGELYCVCCGKIIDWSRPYGLCDNCMENIKWTKGRLCSKCGKMLSPSNQGKVCCNCRANNHSFDRGFACTEYGMYDRSLVFALKSGEKPAIARILGEIMADRMLSEFTKAELRNRYDLLVPVPVTEERILTRGYNQAALISEYFAEKTGLAYNGEILYRKQDTAKMKGLTPTERRINVRGSFDIIKSKKDCVYNASCLIIDDIITTGATADEMAMVLKNNGANRIDILSFANGADVIKS